MNHHAINALLLLVLSPFLVQNEAVAQRASNRGRKPETSKGQDFNPTSLTKLAVLVVGNDSPRETQTDHQRIVEDVFLESLLAKGHAVVARSDIGAVFKEKRFQNSGMTEELAASVGKLLNVPAVLVIRITDVSADQTRTSALVGKASIGARLVNVQTGAILWSGTHSERAVVASKAACSGVILATAVALAEAFPDRAPASDAFSAKPIDPRSLPKLAVIMVGARNGSTSQQGRRGRIAAEGNTSNSQSDQQRHVEDSFIQALIRKGYGLVSRSDLQSVAKEQQFQKSGLTEENAVAAGKLLNVPAVVVVRITDFATESHRDARTRRQSTIARITLGARLLDVNHGEVWWTHSEWVSRELGNKGDVTDVLESVAKEVANFFPPASESSKEQLAQAKKLESMGQITSALNCYQSVIKNHADSPESKKAEARIKALSSKIPATSR